MSGSLASRSVLCDLLGAQAPCWNATSRPSSRSVTSARPFARLETMSELVGRHLPELGGRADWFCLMGLLSAGALATYVPTPPSVLAVHADEPELGSFNLRLKDALRTALSSVLVGVLPLVA